jgi:hypothetical protein
MTGKLQREDACTFDFDIALVGDKIRYETHNDTVGTLMCGSKNDHTARYDPRRSELHMVVIHLHLRNSVTGFTTAWFQTEHSGNAAPSCCISTGAVRPNTAAHANCARYPQE